MWALNTLLLTKRTKAIAMKVAMKVTIVLATLLSLAATMPAAEPARETFDVDLSGLAEAVFEFRDKTGVEKHACGILQICVCDRRVRLVCSPIPRGTTSCIIYKYGKC